VIEIARRVDGAVVVQVEQLVRIDLEVERKGVVNASPVLPTNPST
jgi:hypothetical protein